eukprot:GHVQ01026821.1.p1 GENE.GHVQ01026821.1~~GHVQ01026821.1.p1  ORF type:complete len:331 (+),score=27.43 GHVQ01026821.1:192-1184(+)
MFQCYVFGLCHHGLSQRYRSQKCRQGLDAGVTVSVSSVFFCIFCAFSGLSSSSFCDCWNCPVASVKSFVTKKPWIERRGFPVSTAFLPLLRVVSLRCSGLSFCNCECQERDGYRNGRQRVACRFQNICQTAVGMNGARVYPDSFQTNTGCGCLPHGGRLGFDFSTTLLSSTVSQGWNNIETRTTADETKQTPNTGEVRQGAGTTDDETEEAEIAEDKLTRGQECTMRRQRYKLLQRCKGVRDFYPIDIRRRNWIFDKFRRVSEVYGFEEYESPLLEHRDLYQSTVRKSNGSSKVYNLVDQSGRNLVLRPEVTASLTRMLMSRKTQLCLPV